LTAPAGGAPGAAPPPAPPPPSPSPPPPGGPGGVGGFSPPAVQCDTTNSALPVFSGRVADAETTLAPASVTMNHFDTLPVCDWFSARSVTVVPSLNVADIVAGPAVPVRLNCQVCVPPG